MRDLREMLGGLRRDARRAASSRGETPQGLLISIGMADPEEVSPAAAPSEMHENAESHENVTDDELDALEADEGAETTFPNELVDDGDDYSDPEAVADPNELRRMRKRF